MKERFIIISTILLIWAIVACNTSQTPAPAPVTVEVAKVRIANEQDDFFYSGTIEESETIPLSFSITGNAAKVLVAEGDPVKKGQLLAVIDDATYRNSYEMAVASLNRAEDAYKRLSQMYKNGNLPEIKFVEVQTGLQQAKAAAAIAKKNLDDCNLYATTDGIIGKRAIDPGMMATPNLTSITIVKIDKVYARASISENEISKIKRGQHARIRIGALESSMFDGIVDEIGVMADPLAHTYKIKIGIQNNDHKIKPGMVCNVTIANATDIRNIIIPGESVMVDEMGNNFVYVIDAANNTVVRKPVKIGKLARNGIEIVHGLKEKELVVTSGQHKLADRLPVHIVELHVRNQRK